MKYPDEKAVHVLLHGACQAMKTLITFEYVQYHLHKIYQNKHKICIDDHKSLFKWNYT